MAGVGLDGSEKRRGRVLLVDARPARRELAELALTFVGYVVAVADDAPHAAAVFESFVPDLVISSVDSARDGAMQVHQRLLRLGDATPQLVLASESAFDALIAWQAERRVRILVAPVALQVLVDAVDEVLDPDSSRSRPTIEVDGLRIDPARGRAWFRGEDVSLTPTEFRLLRLLMMNVDRPVSKHDILDYVWRYDFGGRTNAVETYVGYLRRKLAPLGAPQIITVRGTGYLLRADQG